MADAGTVYIDYAARARVPAMTIGGMSIVERVLREAARAGASHAIIRATELPALPPLAIGVEVIPPAAPPPAHAAAIPGDVIAGVAVSDERSRRRASRALLQSLRRPHDGVGDRYVNRALSLPLTGLLCRLGATPNQVTTANIFVGLAACAFVQHAAWWSYAAAGALMILQLVLDSCDGELARIRYMHSRLGMFLDNAADDVIDNLFVAMLALGIGGIWAPIGVVAACARGLAVLMIHVDVARRGRPGDIMSFEWWFDRPQAALVERYDGGPSLVSAVRAIGRRDLYVLLYAAACLLQLPLLGLAIGIAISAFYFVLAVTHLAIRTTAPR